MLNVFLQELVKDGRFDKSGCKMKNVHMYCEPPIVGSSDLIAILTSCLRSFPAVKAFPWKEKARLQFYD